MSGWSVLLLAGVLLTGVRAQAPVLEGWEVAATRQATQFRFYFSGPLPGEPEAFYPAPGRYVIRAAFRPGASTPATLPVARGVVAELQLHRAGEDPSLTEIHLLLNMPSDCRFQLTESRRMLVVEAPFPLLERWEAVSGAEGTEFHLRFSSPVMRISRASFPRPDEFVVEAPFALSMKEPPAFPVARGAVAELRLRPLKADPPESQVRLVLSTPVACRARLEEDGLLLVVEVFDAAAVPASGAERLRAALDEDDLTAGEAIEVIEAEDGVVLRGTVSDPEAARRAEELAQGFGLAFRTELALPAAAGAEEKLEQDIARRYGVRVEVRPQNQGWTVEGEVPERTLQREIPAHVARETGVPVRNRLRLTLPAVPEGVAALPAEDLPRVGVPSGPPIQVAAGESVVVEIPGDLTTAQVANPEVADIVLPGKDAISARHLIVLGIGEGVTTLHLWYQGRRGEERVVGHRVTVYSAEPEQEMVEPPVEGAPARTPADVEEILRQVGIEDVRVVLIAGTDGTSIILHGTVDSEGDRERAEEVVEAFFPRAGDSIKNLTVVRPEPGPQPPQVDPERLQSELGDTLERAGLPGLEGRVVERIGGGWSLLLLGEVESEEAAQRAEQVAEAFAGEQSQVTVTSLLQVKPEEPAAPVLSPEEELAQQVATAIGDPGVRVQVAGGRVILEGEVERTEYRAVAERIAADLSGLPVDNRIMVTRVPQIATDVTMLEINESTLKSLGFDWGALLPGGTIDSGTVVIGEVVPGGTFMRQDPIGARIRALVEEGNARILQKPTVVVDSGEEASINVGGEIPLPESDLLGFGQATQTVRYEPYGVIMQITPTLEPAGEILVDVNAEITELDYSNAVQIGNSLIPGRTRRSVETSAHLRPGQTLAIGGLTAERETFNLTGIPLLRDIPIVGELFETKERQLDKIVLIFLLSPRVLEPEA